MIQVRTGSEEGGTQSDSVSVLSGEPAGYPNELEGCAVIQSGVRPRF